VASQPAFPNWGDFSVTISRQLSGLDPQTLFQWNALSSGKGMEESMFWDSYQFNYPQGSGGYTFTVEEGLCKVEDDPFPPVSELFGKVRAVYVGRQMINGIDCHYWKQPVFSDVMLVYVSLLNVPVREIYITSGYNMTSTYTDFIPATPDPSHFKVPSGCPPPPSSSNSSDSPDENMKQLRQRLQRQAKMTQYAAAVHDESTWPSQHLITTMGTIDAGTITRIEVPGQLGVAKKK